MNDICIKQIIFYTRPWQVLFDLELAKRLTAEFGDIPVKFVTFFSWAKERAKDAGYECIYMPAELEKISGNEISDEKFAEIDRQLYENQGANFNLMLQCERFLPQDGQKAALFGRKHLVVLDRIIIDGTLSISSMYDHFIYWLAGALANIKGGAHFAFVACGMPPGRVLALKTPWETWRVPFEGDAEALLRECQELLHMPAEERIEYMKNQKVPPLPNRLRQRYHELKCENYDYKAGSYFQDTKLFSWLRIKNRLPQRWWEHPEPVYDITKIDQLMRPKHLACYFPLHMEPEATILMYSPWLRNQIEACRLISQALPTGWKLWVKENPKMKGSRPLDYYRQLKNIPHVVLVSPDVASTNLILAANITVTLAGTASIEAAVLGKPSMALGRPPSLGMLSAGDISSQLPLRDLFIQLQKQKFRVDLNAWNNWISASFKGLIVPVFSSEGIFSIPSHEENVEAYKKFIVAAIKQVKEPH